MDHTSSTLAASVRIVDNAEHHRFDLFVGGELIGILGYRRSGSDAAVAFMHTVVTEDFGDRGWAGVLVRGALNTARDRGWSILPVCTYVQRYLARNPEFLDLVAPD
ncbi:N-acetyltransferase [Rhodococcus sp. RS1C4]|uniref:GNAT family N-acetyltransferase n=1 Tax=Rhodococcoides fascians TaxID=1828 RepID=UPI00056A4C02|nr:MULTISPECIES: GNAT family N-acetyltransferase [Rhodococcus]OZC51705.1 N-acetyltransferase [Rhodococcus sp. RS1C4]OZC86810.1 N-acetyltransferase [Rhodococcus sp. 06-418-1B]